jgi:integrase
MIRSLSFVSPFAESLVRFLRFKRAMGFRYRDEERALGALDRFLVSRLSPGDPVITLSMIRDFVARRGGETETTRAHRLTLISQYCRFRAAEDPRTAIPPRRFLPIRRSAFVPRVLSLAEGRRFLKGCLALPAGRCSPLRGVVHGTALALLYLAGLRAGEALGLVSEDVDLASAILRIRGAKFGKCRFVPIAADLNERLRRCRVAVERHFGPRVGQAPFFSGPRGAACRIGALRASFRRVLATAEIPTRAQGRKLRLHDLRRAFAVHRVNLWYRQNEDLAAKLPTLAVYLGHVSLASSQRYLHVTEDALGEIARRHEARFGYLITEGASS